MGNLKKIKKEMKYGAGAGFLKKGRGEGGAGTFSISFFQGLTFLHLEITLPFIFFCHHNFMKKGHSKLSKNEPENIT